MADRLTDEELLVLLIEECSEVIKAATKCLRFGFDVDHGTGYGNNKVELSKECGEVEAIIKALPLDISAKLVAHATKIERAQNAKAKFGRRALQSGGDE